MKKRNFLILLFSALIVTATITSCKKDGEDDDNGGALTASTANVVAGTVDGANISMNLPFVGWEGMPDMNGSNLNYTTGFQNSFDDDYPSLTITFGNVHFPDENVYSTSAFYNYVTLGAGAYVWNINQSSNTTDKKIDIEYHDANGDGWSTKNGSQVGSSFEILDTIRGTKPGGATVKLKAKFNCKVYDGLGGVKTINVTNYVGYLETYE